MEVLYLQIVKLIVLGKVDLGLKYFLKEDIPHHAFPSCATECKYLRQWLVILIHLVVEFLTESLFLLPFITVF